MRTEFGSRKEVNARGAEASHMKRIASGTGNEVYLSVRLHHFDQPGVGHIAVVGKCAAAVSDYFDLRV
jgi:hypothetical protein